MSMLMIFTWPNVVAVLTNICITKGVLQVVKFIIIFSFMNLIPWKVPFFGMLFLFCFITPKHEARKKF